MTDELNDRLAEEVYTKVLNWFKDNGPTPLPSSFDIYFSDKYRVFNLDRRLDNVPFSFIPALAAISHGFSDKDLGKIMLTHGMNISVLGDIDDCSSGENESCLTRHDGSKGYSFTDLSIKVAKSLAAHPGSRIQLQHEKSLGKEIPSNIALACMHTDLRELYPHNIISEHAKALNARPQESPYVEIFEYVPCRILDEKYLPKDSALAFIKRSGLINDVLIKKQTGYFRSWEEMFSLSEQHQYSTIRNILKFCPNAPDPDRERIRRGILSISADCAEISIEAEDMLLHMNRLFKGTDFASITDSLVLQLNLLGTQDFEENLAALMSCNDVGKTLRSNKQTLISALCNELMDIPVEHMGYSHFKAAGKLKLMGLEPQIPKDLDPEKAIAHVLTAFSKFTIPGVIEPNKRSIDQECKSAISDFISTMASHFTLDPDRFTGLDEDSRLLLALSGLDVKKMNLSREHNGIVLEGMLGL